MKAFFFLLLTLWLSLSCDPVNEKREKSDTKVLPVAVALAIPATVKTATIVSAWMIGGGTIIYLSQKGNVVHTANLPYTDKEFANRLNNILHQPITGPRKGIKRKASQFANLLRRGLRKALGRVPSGVAASSLLGLYDTLNNTQRLVYNKLLTKAYYTANAKALGHMGYARFKSTSKEIIDFNTFNAVTATQIATKITALSFVRNKFEKLKNGSMCFVTTIQNKCNGNVATPASLPSTKGYSVSMMSLIAKGLAFLKCGAQVADHFPSLPDLDPVKVKTVEGWLTIRNLCTTAASSVSAAEPGDGNLTGVLKGSTERWIRIFQAAINHIGPVVETSFPGFSKLVEQGRLGAFLAIASWACHNPVSTIQDQPCNPSALQAEIATSSEEKPSGPHHPHAYRCVRNQAIIPIGTKPYTNPSCYK